MYCGVDVIVREAIQAAAGANLENWLKLASAAGQAGNHQEAYNYYTKVLEVDSSNWKAWMGRAEAAGWMSQPQQFRLPEMMTGIRRALEAAPQDQRKEVAAQASNAIIRVISYYHAQMRSWFYPLLGNSNYWQQYLAQCSTLIDILEDGHRLFPKDEHIVRTIVQICSDNLRNIPYTGTMNNRPVQMWRELPNDLKFSLRAKMESYSQILRELDPFAPPVRVPQPSIFDSLQKLPVPVWIGIGFAGLLVIGMLGTILDKDKRSRSNDVMPQSMTTSASPQQDSLSSSQRLAEAKRALADGYSPNKDPMKTSWGRVADARRHLEAIRPDAKEYAEAQKLMKEVERREGEIERMAKKVARQLVAEQMEQRMLSQGMDMQFTTSGADNSTLTIKYVLMSRPLVYKLTNESDFLSNMRNAGFRKVIFTDGYNESWTYDL